MIPAGRGAAAARPWTWAALLWIGALAAATTALTLEHGFGFAPCNLCLYERVPYYATLALLPAAAALGRPRLGLLAAGLLLLVNVGLSAYHVAIEQGLIPLPAGCIAGTAATTVEELRAQLMAARPTCDQASATFLGLSLAAWNLLYAAALGSLALMAAWLTGRERPTPVGTGRGS